MFRTKKIDIDKFLSQCYRIICAPMKAGRIGAVASAAVASASAEADGSSANTSSIAATAPVWRADNSTAIAMCVGKQWQFTSTPKLLPRYNKQTQGLQQQQGRKGKCCSEKAMYAGHAAR